MIAKLTGLLDSVGDDWAIIDVGGVGYLVHSSSRSLSSLPARGEVARMHIETVVREDAITLFGFVDVVERDMFRLLTSVQGVGAKVGLAILSALSPTDLQNAIAAQDKTAVSRAKGVGPKVATRIVTELKDKVTGLVFSPKGVEMGTMGVPQSAQTGGSAQSAQQSALEDAVSALVNLGYKRVEAHGAVAKVMADFGEDATVAALVPAALKELSSL
ncbi:Holliday junction branch migration protein RuvA [Kordiimonas lacus]|uniref:Holliday junction branch migration complex subunit RuvA n=1 Tax=Kordiimonas lacus TaxID=637679 RepID=A0A1G6YUZ2_9PROT|nr:Holliday junction branch migration protein RuvA [Kordiimonas lacus]SDD93406.1 Holliday junction DNA helicase subunit RuvA [Kordiimonas lacus]